MPTPRRDTFNTSKTRVVLLIKKMSLMLFLRRSHLGIHLIRKFNLQKKEWELKFRMKTIPIAILIKMCRILSQPKYWEADFAFAA